MVAARARGPRIGTTARAQTRSTSAEYRADHGDAGSARRAACHSASRAATVPPTATLASAAVRLRAARASLRSPTGSAPPCTAAMAFNASRRAAAIGMAG